MKNKLKIKINGEDLPNLFLAFLLLKKGFKVQIIKNNSSKDIGKSKLFLISHSTKLMLDDLNLWDKLKYKAYSVGSLLISDVSLFEKLNFSFEDSYFNNKVQDNIGWIINYSDISELLLYELSKFNNIFSDININKNSYLNSYKNLNSTLKENSKRNFFIPILSKNKKSCIEFTVLVRGNADKKFYTLLTKKGIIFLVPINKNLFRVKWILKNFILESMLRNGNSFLLDNLSTILPNELIVDQIIDDLNISPNYLPIFSPLSKFKKNFVTTDDSYLLCDLKLYDLNLSFREVIFIYNLIADLNLKNLTELGILKFKILILKTSKFILSFIIYELFLINNFFLKRIIFYLLKKFTVLKRLFLNLLFLNF